MKSYAPAIAGVTCFLTAIVMASVLTNPSKYWHIWLLNHAHQLIADTHFARIDHASAYAVAIAFGLIAAIVALLVFARLEILAAKWASEKSASALRGKDGEMTVEQEVKALVRRFGRK